MTNLTLDTNGLIAIEKEETTSGDVLRLRDLDGERRINLKLVAASASENQVGDRLLGTFAEFQDWLGTLGFQNQEVLRPLCIWGVGFWDFCLWGDGAGREELLYRQLWSVLTAGRAIPTLPDNDSDARKYRNAVCDTLMIWSHIYYGGDIFVTTDTRHFNNKARHGALLSLGAKAIMTPREAVEALR